MCFFSVAERRFLGVLDKTLTFFSVVKIHDEQMKINNENILDKYLHCSVVRNDLIEQLIWGQLHLDQHKDKGHFLPVLVYESGSFLVFRYLMQKVVTSDICRSTQRLGRCKQLLVQWASLVVLWSNKVQLPYSYLQSLMQIWHRWHPFFIAKCEVFTLT